MYFSCLLMCKKSVTVSKSTVFVSSFSIDKMPKSASQSCVMVERRQLFISFNLLKDYSAEATITGAVPNIRRAIQLFGKSDVYYGDCRENLLGPMALFHN